jgi:hypothetical protein
MEAARTSETLVKFYQTTRLYNPEDSHLPLHPVKIGVWCAVPRRRIVGPFLFFENTINSERYVVIVHAFLGHLTEGAIAEAWFQHDCATCHAARRLTNLVIPISNHFERTMAPTLAGFVTTKFSSVGLHYRQCLP